MSGLRAALWRVMTRSPSNVEQRLRRALAARHSARTPFCDSPPYASSEDSEVPYGLLNRSGMIALAFRFLYGNLLSGSYLEFGCATGRTFRLAWQHHQRHFAGRMHFWLFDSFQGLPALGALDAHPKWRAGDLRMSVEELRQVADEAGIPRSAYMIVPGYYSDVLTDELARDLATRGVRAGVVYVDCDLYESTRCVLRFVRPLLQPGTVVCFDDFYCFNGDPDRGEQLAMREFLAQYPEVGLVEYVNFGWHGKSFIVHLRGTSDAPGDRA